MAASHPYHSDGDTSFCRSSNQPSAAMWIACGLNALAVQALPAESFVGVGSNSDAAASTRDWTKQSRKAA
jgi:hypothetical protein